MSWRGRLLGLRLALGIVAAGSSSLALSQSLAPVSWATFAYTFLALTVLTTLLLSRGKWVKALAGLHLVALAPAILSHSSVNWFRFLLHRPLNYPALPLPETIALGLVTSFCILTIYLTIRLRETSSHLVAHGVETNDQSTFLRSSLLVGFTVVSSAAAVTVAGLLIPLGMTRGLNQVLEYIPWSLATLGLVGSALLAVLVFQAMLSRTTD